MFVLTTMYICNLPRLIVDAVPAVGWLNFGVVLSVSDLVQVMFLEIYALKTDKM